MATTVRKAPARRGAKQATKKTASKKATKKTATKKSAKTAAKTATGKAVAKTAAKKPATRAAAKKTTARPAAKQAPAKKAVAKNAAAKKVVAKQPIPRKAPRTAASKPRAKGSITPAQALANTRRLLEAKHAHDREAPPWQALEGRHGTTPQAGFQDEQARDQANELHAGESRMDAIQGAIGTQDRHNQGKRDQR